MVLDICTTPMMLIIWHGAQDLSPVIGLHELYDPMQLTSMTLIRLLGVS